MTRPNTTRAVVAALTATLLLAGCGGDDDHEADVSGDVGDVGDDGATDVEAGDVGHDGSDDADVSPDADVAPDADVDDTTPDVDDADTDDVEPDLPPPECESVEPPEPDAVDPEQRKFALTMFHFNVEYVIGGLEYVNPDTGELEPFLGLPFNVGWDNDRVEDYIIRDTLMPILELYDRHPTWRVTIEFQAYALEIMAQRHRDVLDLLRTLAQRGQVEVVSFHYAAQLFLGFPLEDQVRSLAATRQVFDENCVPLSGVVFNQEGQAGEGRQRLLVDEGYSIGVFPKNLWRYVRGETPWPVYSSEGGRLIVGPGGVDPESGIEVTWPFFDDGELRAVGGAGNPYTAPISPTDPARVAEYESQLEALEADGWKLTSIADYVHQVEGMGVEVRPAPPLLDGTWQPPSTESIHRWLGGRSQANVNDEEDNRVRSGNAVARMNVDATQVLRDAAAATGITDSAWDAELAEIWKALWHAQVSDASGVNPWRGEVLWCIALNEEVLARTAALRQEILSALGWDFVEVDLAARTALELDDLALPEPPDVTTPWFDVDVQAEGRTAEVTWFEGPDADEAVVVIRFSAGAACDGCDNRRLDVSFPWDATHLRYSPGLIEDEVREYSMESFTLSEGEAYLPLPNGLIGLTDGVWLIKDARTTHIAARIAPPDEHVRFIDAALRPETAPTWTFAVFRGTAEEALRRANRRNVDPIVYYSRTAD
ncbi:MAG: hypothetical protein H6700_05940 [Myxococcales bacterium]|nr:hypothetical protein [Myxococcales bacterium]MCB9519389.1 hypothetical protein [Myxococcales bacterium]MCB9531288.1 hypothetical protein [Myxococcales bacterium]